MTVDNSTGSSGAKDATSGAPANESNLVPKDAYEKLLKEKRNATAALAEKMGKLAEYEALEAKRAEEEAAARGEHEKLIAKLKEDLQAKEKTLLQLNQEKLVNLKREAFKQTFQNFNDNYMGLVDLNSIEIDASGSVDQQSVMNLVDSFKKKYPEVVQSKVNVHTPNPKGASGANGLTYEQWKALPLKERKERMSEVIDK